MKISANKYCEMFRLNEPYYNFNRRAFIKSFGLDFVDSCRLSDDINPHTGYIKYKAFKLEILEAEKRFEEISEIMVRAGKRPLSKGLWNAFYSLYVIETRRALFKVVQQRIDHKKKIAAAQWASLKVLRDKMTDEDKTKIKPGDPGKRNP